MIFDPSVWGPHYWFTLHTIAMCYPLHPNEVTKKKYYDFIQNLPLFIPIQQIGDGFSKFLDKYPVTPYLDSRESFMKWMHFIHNKINNSLKLPELTMEEATHQYYELYKPKEVVDDSHRKRREKIAFIGIVVTILILGGYFYKK
ncbi:MAG: FAD-linked sulfhydryl oxidase [Promethearchaeota archaeon]|jgi:hypothetical protein